MRETGSAWVWTLGLGLVLGVLAEPAQAQLRARYRGTGTVDFRGDSNRYWCRLDNTHGGARKTERLFLLGPWRAALRVDEAAGGVVSVSGSARHNSVPPGPEHAADAAMGGAFGIGLTIPDREGGRSAIRAGRVVHPPAHSDAHSVRLFYVRGARYAAFLRGKHRAVQIAQRGRGRGGATRRTASLQLPLPGQPGGSFALARADLRAFDLRTGPLGPQLMDFRLQWALNAEGRTFAAQVQDLQLEFLPFDLQGFPAMGLTRAVLAPNPDPFGVWDPLSGILYTDVNVQWLDLAGNVAAAGDLLLEFRCVLGRNGRLRAMRAVDLSLGFTQLPGPPGPQPPGPQPPGPQPPGPQPPGPQPPGPQPPGPQPPGPPGR